MYSSFLEYSLLVNEITSVSLSDFKITEIHLQKSIGELQTLKNAVMMISGVSRHVDQQHVMSFSLNLRYDTIYIIKIAQSVCVTSAKRDTRLRKARLWLVPYKIL